MYIGMEQHWEGRWHDTAETYKHPCRSSSSNTRAGVGLTSMRERATELGGRLVVEGLPGGGTCVYAELPLPQED